MTERNQLPTDSWLNRPLCSYDIWNSSDVTAVRQAVQRSGRRVLGEPLTAEIRPLLEQVPDPELRNLITATRGIINVSAVLGWKAWTVFPDYLSAGYYIGRLAIPVHNEVTHSKKGKNGKQLKKNDDYLKAIQAALDKRRTYVAEHGLGTLHTTALDFLQDFVSGKPSDVPSIRTRAREIGIFELLSTK